jgi:hypothetical protein
MSQILANYFKLLKLFLGALKSHCPVSQRYMPRHTNAEKHAFFRLWMAKIYSRDTNFSEKWGHSEGQPWSQATYKPVLPRPKKSEYQFGIKPGGEFLLTDLRNALQCALCNHRTSLAPHITRAIS